MDEDMPIRGDGRGQRLTFSGQIADPQAKPVQGNSPRSKEILS